MATWGIPMTTWTGVQGWQRPQLPRHVGGEEPTNNLLLMCAYVARRGPRSPTAAARLVDDAGSSCCCCCCFFSFQIVKVGSALRIAFCCRYVRTKDRRGQESLLEGIRRWSRFHTTGLMSAALLQVATLRILELVDQTCWGGGKLQYLLQLVRDDFVFYHLVVLLRRSCCTNLRKFVNWVSTESYSQADQQLSAAFSRYKLHT